jgi:hypothetical protein
MGNISFLAIEVLVQGHLPRLLERHLQINLERQHLSFQDLVIMKVLQNSEYMEIQNILRQQQMDFKQFNELETNFCSIKLFII